MSGTVRGRLLLWIMVSVCHRHWITGRLSFGEFEQHIDQMLFVSATPSTYEEEHELLRHRADYPADGTSGSGDFRPSGGRTD